MNKFGYRGMLDNLSGTFSEPSETDLEDLDRLALSMTGTKDFHKTTDSFLNNLLVVLKTTGINFLESFGFNIEVEKLEDSKIPAGYTYLAQFIAHDISQDEKTDREVSGHSPFDPELVITDIKNLKNPILDLETIYGKLSKEKVPEEKYLEDDKATLKLDFTKEDSEETKSFPNDFNRQISGKPIIADLRNDENLLIAQMQIAFMKFHNAVVAELKNKSIASESIFTQARTIVIRHYQYIVLNDFLPQIIQPTILKRVINYFEANNKSNLLYNTQSGDADYLYLPLEFTVGAFRFGHSMIRNSYNLNNKILAKAAKLFHLISFIKNTFVSLDNKLRSSWVINWSWFFDIKGSKKNENFNVAKKINTKYEGLLGTLPSVPGNPRINSLSAIDLYRGVRWKLPYGQSVVKLINEKLKSENLEPLRELEKKDLLNTFRSNLTDDQKVKFGENTPFLYYILAEAERQEEGEKLGDVGSWIVAEVIIKLLDESPYSIIKEKLEEDNEFLGKRFEGKFGIAEMLLYTGEVLNKDFDTVIDPIGQSLSK